MLASSGAAASSTRSNTPSLRRATRLGVLGLGLALFACRPQQTTAPGDSGPVAWIDADPLQPAEIPPANASSRAAAARLDRLLDLLDAARFTGDEGAREALWTALGGAARGRGPEATREAETRLLTEALALDLKPDLDDDARGFLAGAITLLSADLGLVAGSEDLSVRVAAYRNIAEDGHPRAADNARWRLYDHVRGCLAGAAAAAPERRLEVAVHGLYVREDSLAAWLDDRAVHAQAPWPPPAELWGLLTAERDALAALPRWRGVLARRDRGDAVLQDTFLAALPAARDPAWDLQRVPAGTGRKDSLAPVVGIAGEDVTVDLGRPGARRSTRGAPELVRAVEAALARDGRGAVLLVAPPLLPSPALNSILRTLLDARVARIESAVREPRLPEGTGDIIAALPLEVVRPSDQGPAAQVLSRARVRVHLGGRGPRVAVDGGWLDLLPGPSDLDAQLARLDRAYPRERMVTLTLGDDVLYQQLQDLLRALVGGPQRRFDVVAWTPAAAPPPADLPEKSLAEARRRLDVRAGLFTRTASAGLVLPAPPPGAPAEPLLPEGDHKRAEALALGFVRCLPELETPLRPGEFVDVELRFEEGRLAGVEPRPPKTRVPPPRLAALKTCVEDEARGFRLREQQAGVRFTVRVRPS
ncbi:hypothetical protein SAMN02745121_00006 [Nannocystis exedens]|uniref:Uncharacterized protein n=1 Tax=Nannocystis exedens TaxID=54 RepID=A0A1I1SKY3_9BACT|nr:hypothetical protein [Nannocystis exedens]PCC75467.1 hypothetical protein NAEX_08577 [Nannocystis exedens]SFD45338.1 hypothetical protein SAMN02745121_00006 [Nannocystis exedens]